VRSARTVGFSLLLGAQLAVGAAAIFARYALKGAEPLAVAALRLVIAALVLLALAVFTRHAQPRLSAHERTILALAGLALAIHFATWIWSLRYASVAVSTLLVCTTPIWTSLYDAVVLRKRLARTVWLAYAAGALGLCLVVGFGGSPPPVSGHPFLGAGLALCGSFAIGAYFMLVREVRAAMTTTRIVTQTYGWAAVALVVAAAAARQPPPSMHAKTAWLAILGMALVSQLLGHTALNASLRWFSPSAIAMTTLLEPVFAAILAAAVFGERLTSLALAGGAILLAAIGIVLVHETPPAPELKLD
jgi:drug/metabolite transporter (DMT)-like permease